MREDDAHVKRKAWLAKGNPACPHSTLMLLYTQDNYCTGDYVCVECGERVGKVGKNGRTE